MVFRNVYLEEMGLSGSAMGLIGFLMLASGVVVQPIWGLLSDSFRVERTVPVVGTTISGIAILAYPLGETLSDPLLVLAVGTVIYSAARSPVIPMATGMVLDRGFDYESVRAFGSLTFAIGSLGFGILVASLGSVSIIYVYVPGAVAIVLITLSLPDDVDDGEDEETEGPPIREAAVALVTNPTFLVILAASFLLRLSIMGAKRSSRCTCARSRSTSSSDRGRSAPTASPASRGR